VAHGSSGVDSRARLVRDDALHLRREGDWLLWVWPLFSVIYRMMYLGTWVRRSNVLTGAEWNAERVSDSAAARSWLHQRGGLRDGARGGFLSYAPFAASANSRDPFSRGIFPDNWYGAGSCW